MATTSTTTFESRIPQEPLPVPPVVCDEKPPSVDTEEESFVVLGKYVTGDFEYLSSEDEHSNVGKSMIQEAKQLLKEELDRIENSSIPPQPTQKNVNRVPENLAANNIENGSETLATQQLYPQVDIEESTKIEVWKNKQKLSEKETQLQTVQKDLEASQQGQKNESADLQRQLQEKQDEPDDMLAVLCLLCRYKVDFEAEREAKEDIKRDKNKLSEDLQNLHRRNQQLQEEIELLREQLKQYGGVQHTRHETTTGGQGTSNWSTELKKENTALNQEIALLHQEIENLRYTLKLQESENAKSKQIITHSSENNFKEFELDAANKRIKKLEESIAKLSKNIDKDLHAESKWTAMEEKLARYEKELEDVYKKNRELEKNTLQDDLANNLAKLKITEEKLVLAEKAADQANKEVLSLRTHLAKNLQISEESPKMVFELQQAKHKIKELEDLVTSSIDANMRLKKSEEELGHAKEKIKAMEANALLLQKQLEETKIEAWKNKQKLSEKETQLQIVQKDLEASQQQKQLQEAQYNPNEIAYLRQQLMQSQMAMTQCDQNRAVAYAQLERQKNQIADLQRQLQEKQDETDDMLALRTQLDLYKVDFEAEREAQEVVKRDKNKLSEDLQHLHRRNQQLQEEIELLREQLKQYGGVQYTRHETTTGGQGTSNWSTERGRNPQSNFKCPKCQFGFSTLNAVENHVMRCIDLDDSLP